MEPLIGLIVVVFLGGSALSGVKIIKQGEEALVETLGKYNGKKLTPGLNFMIPVYQRIAYQATIRERVMEVPPQSCITRDNVSITVDAVVYWRIIDMEKAYYKVENLYSALQNLILTQIRAEMGTLDLDETFTARTKINEFLLRELDIATEPWGIKVTRVELRDLIPSQAVQESMELQMSAERKKRAAILNSEGEREAAINSARGQAEARVLDAEARQKSVVLDAQAQQQALILKAQAEYRQQILKSQAIAESAEIIAQRIKNNPQAAQALEVLFALGYLDMGATIGKSDSSKVMFIDPRSIPATLEGIRSIVGEMNQPAPQFLELDEEA
jgi:regulator of protease activity HflC (stomatin/prohibitin superfamily)